MLNKSMSLTVYRFYHEPDPPVRAILDSVSSLSVAIKNSLCVGVTRKRTFALEFPRHVFNYSKVRGLSLKTIQVECTKGPIFCQITSMIAIFSTTTSIAKAVL